jgi:hypothetical protein
MRLDRVSAERPILHSDPDIAAGLSARKGGRYDLAVQAFCRAQARADSAGEARQLEFAALREVDISRHLVGRLLRRLGMTMADHGGFGAIEPTLREAAVRRRLEELAAAERPGENFRATLEADRLSRGDPGGDPPLPDDAATGPDVRVAWARHELARGRPHHALAQLSRTVLDEAPSAAAQRVFGIALWKAGDRAAAMNAFNLSLMYLSGKLVRGRLQFQTAYKDHRIVFLQGEFYAIPDWRDPVLEENGGEAKLVAHRLPRHLRQALRRLLPARVLDLIYRAMTWLGLRGEVRLEETVHSPDLLAVLRAVDDMRTRNRLVRRAASLSAPGRR